MPTNPDLSWRTLSRALSELRMNNSWLRTFLIGDAEFTKPTRQVEMSLWVSGREMAPFAVRGVNALPVKGMSKAFTTFEFPHIRLKRPINIPQYLNSRTPGTSVYLVEGGDNQRAAVEDAILKDVSRMRSMADETIEWMIAQLLTGVVTAPTYSAPDQAPDYFTVTYQRPAGHTITNAGNDRWSVTSGYTEAPKGTLLKIQRLMDAVGFQVTDVILGRTAATAFENHPEVLAAVDRLRSNPGTMDLLQVYNKQGARLIANLYGVNWWEYARSTVTPSGSTVQLIGDDKAHFVSRTPETGFRLEFGGIEDARAFRQGIIEAKYFSKTWIEEDPGHEIALLETNPLPMYDRPEGTATVTVV